MAENIFSPLVCYVLNVNINNNFNRQGERERGRERERERERESLTQVREWAASGILGKIDD